MAHTNAPPVDRVKWFRSRADRDRWQEEIEKLEVEFTCTILFHTKMAALWRELANKVEGNEPADLGRRAYALRTAAVYTRLRDHAQTMFDKAKAKGHPSTIPEPAATTFPSLG